MSSAWSSPVLQSVEPVVAASSHVRTDREAIERVASWMAYEDFPLPSGDAAGPFHYGPDPNVLVDVVFVVSALNFAFTDFATGVKFEAEYQGRTWSDSEAMFAKVHEAVTGGVPLLDADFLATVGRDDLARIFTGNIEMPMLDDRVRILNEIGAVLGDRYQGRFHVFFADCAPAMYADGDGLLERLVAEFPRFDDVSAYRGSIVRFYKLAQLCLWALHRGLHPAWGLRDLHRMTAFADYIVPVALRLLGIFEYSEELEGRIARGDLIERDGEEEIEIRAGTLYATALLTDAVNAIRPPSLQVVIPQVDYRLWKAYHATFLPHHLTRTIMY